MASPPDFVLDERVHARREEVFRAWTEADRFARWFAPLPGASVEVVRLGAAVGAAIDLRVLRAGAPPLGLRGRVAVAERPGRLEWELEPGSVGLDASEPWRLALRLDEHERGTRVALEVAGAGAAADALRAALGHALGRLPAALDEALERFAGTVGRQATTRSRFGGTWVDRSDAPERLAGMRELGWITDEEVERLDSFREDGFLVLEGAVDAEHVEAVNADIERAWRGELEGVWVESFRDDTITYARADAGLRGFPHKLLELHGHSRAARDAIFSAPVLRFLNLLFQAPALAFQSLTFELGTQQDMHQDTAFVLVSSPLEFVGCWMALEDVREGSGELQYYRGSHRIDEYLWPGGTRAKPHGYRDDAEFLAWMHAGPQQQGCELVRFRPRAGDVLLWHADLVHGGAPRTVEGVTRRSLVTHLCPTTVDPAWWGNCDHTQRHQHAPGAWTTHRTSF